MKSPGFSNRLDEGVRKRKVLRMIVGFLAASTIHGAREHSRRSKAEANDVDFISCTCVGDDSEGDKWKDGVGS